MLEVLYDIATNEVRAWNADMKVKGNLKLKEGQEVVILPIDPPDFGSDIYYVDLQKQTVIGNPDYIEPEPVRDDSAEIDKLWEEVRKLKEVKDGTRY